MDLHKISEYFYPRTILDIGANVGQFHKRCKQVFPDSYVFSIEASEDCEKHLKEITPNYYIGLLSKDNSQYDFYSRKDDSMGTGNSIYRELTRFYSDDNLDIIKKQGIRLDDLFEHDVPFDLIKIDTQGSELDIIRGGMQICKKAKGLILEVSITQYNDNAPLYDEVMEFVNNMGFTSKEILDEQRNHGSHQQDILFVNNNN